MSSEQHDTHYSRLTIWDELRREYAYVVCDGHNPDDPNALIFVAVSVPRDSLGLIGDVVRFWNPSARIFVDGTMFVSQITALQLPKTATIQMWETAETAARARDVFNQRIGIHREAEAAKRRLGFASRQIDRESVPTWIARNWHRLSGHPDELDRVIRRGKEAVHDASHRLDALDEQAEQLYAIRRNELIAAANRAHQETPIYGRSNVLVVLDFWLLGDTTVVDALRKSDVPFVVLAQQHDGPEIVNF